MKFELKNGDFNVITSEMQILLLEQVFKFILKINSQIPKDDYIEHIMP